MFAYKITALALLAAGVAAQNLPSCAATCVGSNYAGCSQFDVTCICSSSQWISGLACCVSQTCSPADQDATIQYANKICAGVGITTLPQTATCASTSSAPAPSSSQSYPTASALTLTSTPPAVTPVVGSVAPGSGGALTSPATSSGTGAPVASSSVTLSGSASPAASSARASQSGAANKAGSIGMGAVIAGLAVAAL